TVAPANTIGSGNSPQISRSSPSAQNSAEYSNGAITDTGAERNASVISTWPRAPVAPSANSSPASPARTPCQSGNASRPAPIATIAMNQNDIAAVESVRPRTRTVIAFNA